MRNFIEYLDYDLAGNLTSPCSDRAIVILDGRNTLERMIQDGHDNNGHRRPHFPHFNIHAGNLRESRIIYTTNRSK